MMTTAEIKTAAAEVAAALQSAGGGTEPIAGTGGGSRHRGLPEEVRKTFLAVRAELFQRGIYDPVLVRFDTATVAQAPNAEIAAALAKVAEGL
jgi:hypothetical protein